MMFSPISDQGNGNQWQDKMSFYAHFIGESKNSNNTR